MYIPYPSNTHTQSLAICMFLCMLLCSCSYSFCPLFVDQTTKWMNLLRYTFRIKLSNVLFTLLKNYRILFLFSPDDVQIDPWSLLPVHMFLEMNMWASKLMWFFGSQRRRRQTWLTTTSDLPLAIRFPSPSPLCWCEGGMHVLKWVISISS